MTMEEILNKARDVAAGAERKTTELVGKTKIKMEISSIQKQLAAVFEGIGRLEFDAASSGEDITVLKAEAFETVRELQKELEKQYDRWYDMNGAVRCGACDAVNEGDAAFCKKCGKTL